MNPNHSIMSKTTRTLVWHACSTQTVYAHSSICSRFLTDRTVSIFMVWMTIKVFKGLRLIIGLHSPILLPSEEKVGIKTLSVWIYSLDWPLVNKLDNNILYQSAPVHWLQQRHFWRWSKSYFIPILNNRQKPWVKVWQLTPFLEKMGQSGSHRDLCQQNLCKQLSIVRPLSPYLLIALLCRIPF